MSTPASLIEHFSRLDDPRVERNKKHELIDVIVLSVCAVLSGAEGWSDIEEFGRNKLQWLRRYVALANGIPVDDTIARIISALSVTGFQECFMSWMEDAAKLSRGEIIALDGKTQRRSYDRRHRVSALHMVSAWACRNGVVLGGTDQIRVIHLYTCERLGPEARSARGWAGREVRARQRPAVSSALVRAGSRAA